MRFKESHLLLCVFLVIQVAYSQSVITAPCGFARVTIEGAPAFGQAQFTAISSTFLNKPVFIGEATLGDDFASDEQTVAFSGEVWTGGQFTVEPHILFLANENGGTEGFLILSHDTAGTVTISSEVNLRGTNGTHVSFPAAQVGVIRKANTIRSLFSSVESGLGADDVVFLYSGVWEGFRYTGTKWIPITNPFSVDVGGTVVFPEEGMFVSRSETTPLQVTFAGDVPTSVQSASISGAGFNLFSNRYPKSSTLAEQGIEGMDGWSSNDVVWIFENVWAGYYHNGTKWVPKNNPFGDADSLLIEANSVLFIERSGASETQFDPPLPYDPYAP